MNSILDFIANNQKQVLDITGAVLGIIYILLEYRASIWLWPVSIVMPLVDMMLYFEAGLYADFAMAIYYALAAVYGYIMWKKAPSVSSKAPSKSPPAGETLDSASEDSNTKVSPAGGDLEGASGTVDRSITLFPARLIVPTTVAFALLWLAIWFVLSHFTNSTVPVRDAFTTALSMIALWALARKYVEQWLMWLVVDLISFWLYFEKGIPFKGLLYAFYCFMAVAGYIRWRKLARQSSCAAR